MTRILMIQTASPKRIRRKAEEMLQGSIYPAPEITLLSKDHPGIMRYFSELPGLRVVPLRELRKRKILEAIGRDKFDVLYIFWTGEACYRWNKIAALRLAGRSTIVDIGDGHVFPLTMRNLVHFCLIRWKYPLPSDHYDFVQRWETPRDQDYYDGERVLIIQSAEPPYILRTLDLLREQPIFRNPRYTIFCRNMPEVTQRFAAHPMLHEVRPHSEAQNSWKHLCKMRREHYDAVMVFFTGDPSYWKIKYFAFMLGARHKLIVNENSDCFFFSWGAWLALLAHRLEERSRTSVNTRWSYQLRLLVFLVTKIVIFPLRFAWLLLVWLRLRLAALKGTLFCVIIGSFYGMKFL